MQTQGQHPSLVQTHKELRFVKKIEMRKTLSVWYPVFTVVRDDGQDWIFSQADFINLNLNDLEIIYHEFRNRTNQPEPIQIAMKAVNRFLRRQVTISHATDFQLTLESNQPKVNLLKPNQTLLGLEDLPMFKVIIKSTAGMVYPNLQ